MPWGSPVELETKLHIQLSIAAYAYEIEHDSLISDHEFDEACKQVDLSIDTTRPHLDAYFREHFDPSTGMWIHFHPELARIRELYLQLKSRLDK